MYTPRLLTDCKHISIPNRWEFLTSNSTHKVDQPQVTLNITHGFREWSFRRCHLPQGEFSTNMIWNNITRQVPCWHGQWSRFSPARFMNIVDWTNDRYILESQTLKLCQHHLAVSSTSKLSSSLLQSALVHCSIEEFVIRAKLHYYYDAYT